MIRGRRPASAAASERYAADKELAGRFGELLAAARAADDAVVQAQARSAPRSGRGATTTGSTAARPRQSRAYEN